MCFDAVRGRVEPLFVTRIDVDMPTIFRGCVGWNEVEITVYLVIGVSNLRADGISFVQGQLRR